MASTTWEAWSTDEIDGWVCDLTTVNTDVVEAVGILAQRMLWARAGRRHGTAVTVDDQYRISRAGGRCGGPWESVFGWHGDHVCCAIPLEYQPVRRIDAVRIHGVALDPGDYRLDLGRVLRIGACWPAVAECDEPAISIDYTWGVPVGPDLRLAFAEVVCELIKAVNGEDCSLNAHVVNVARQGVTQQFEDLPTIIETGLIGTPIADEWIRNVNPGRLQQRSRVYSPDLPRRA